MAEATEAPRHPRESEDPASSLSPREKRDSRLRGNDAEQNHRALGFTVAGLIFLADQITKYIVTYPLQLQQRRIMPLLDIFDLRWVENRGVSMGFLTATSDLTRWLLVALTAAISVGVVDGGKEVVTERETGRTPNALRFDGNDWSEVPLPGLGRGTHAGAQPRVRGSGRPAYRHRREGQV